MKKHQQRVTNLLKETSNWKLILFIVPFVALGLFLLQFTLAGSVDTKVNQIYIEPNTYDLKTGDTFESIIRINTEGKLVNAVEANIRYSAESLEIVDTVNFAKSDFGLGLTARLSDGTIDIMRANFDSIEGDTLELGRVTFKVTGTTGSAKIEVLDNSQLISSVNNRNIVESTGASTISINGGSVSQKTARLSLKPRKANVPKNDLVRVDILVDSPVEGSSKVKTNIGYSKQKLKFINIEADSSVFERAETAIAEDGRVSITRTNRDPVKGQQLNVATIVFQAITDTGEANLSLLNSSTVESSESGNNILDTVDDAIIAFGSAKTQNTAPVFTNNATVSVTEDTNEVIQIIATDPDNDAFSLAISGGVDAEHFILESNTGVFSTTENTSTLFLIPLANFEKPTDVGRNNMYDVVITASDEHGNESEQEISVTITDTNEAPSFDNKTYLKAGSLEIDENQTYITTLQARHDDVSQGLEYLVVDGEDKDAFTIDRSSGVLSFSAPADFETPKDANKDGVYEAIAVVSDTSSDRLFDDLGIRVTVLDIDENNSNKAPEVNAGSDKSLDLSDGLQLTLNGRATSTGNGLKTIWKVVSGPAGGVKISDPTALNPELTFGRPGTYVLRLSANDSKLITSDTITIQVGDSRGSIDSDSISDTVEDAGPGGGDGNADSTPDSQQDNVATNIATYIITDPSQAGSGFVTLESLVCETIYDFSNVAESDFDVSDAENIYPQGLFSAEVGCEAAGKAANLTFYFDKDFDSQDWVWRAYSPGEGTYNSVDVTVNYNFVTIDDREVLAATIELADGGALDNDKMENGILSFIIGPSIPGTNEDLESLSEVAQAFAEIDELQIADNISATVIATIVISILITISAVIFIVLQTSNYMSETKTDEATVSTSAIADLSLRDLSRLGQPESKKNNDDPKKLKDKSVHEKRRD